MPVLVSAALVVAVGAGTALYATTNVVRRDHKPPEISVETETLEVSVGYTREDLLQGVTARDRRDGDVTASLVVEDISDITPQHTAQITYAAFDRAGNVQKATRTLSFTDYQPPRFGQRRALVLSESNSQDVLSFLSATDLVDGDISDHIKGNLVSDTVSLSYPGVHQVEFRVTNSMGDTSRITLPVDVYPATAYNAGVELSDYLIYLPKGTPFRPDSYLRSLKVGSMEYSLEEEDEDTVILINRVYAPGIESARHVIRVDMDDDVNTAVPGVYSVTYTVTMNDQYTGFTRLNVVVEE